MLTEIVLLALAYLIGSIPFGYLLVKHVFTAGEDVRTVGSGGTGATNVTRRAGTTAGLLTYVLDAVKGSAAVLLMRGMAPDNYLWIGGSVLAAILGHVFPVFLGFKGGKGVATGMGAFMVLAPVPVLASLGVWGIVVAVTRYVSLGSLVAAGGLPVLILLYYGWVEPSRHALSLFAIAVLGCAVVVSKHRDNFVRLLAGTENRLGGRVGAAESSKPASRKNGGPGP